MRPARGRAEPSLHQLRRRRRRRGFAPGFGYLASRVHTISISRLHTPRVKTPAGSIAMADTFTGIYPRESPGGWGIIGRTDELLFDIDRDPATALLPGRAIQFGEIPMSRPTPAMKVVRAGLLTTVQDLGRRGYASMGVGVSGAVDRTSHNRANRLVGNLPSAATLELTFGGFRAVASSHLLVAATGANADIRVDNIAHPIDTLLAVRPGQCIHIGMPSIGIRTYLAIRGGIDVPAVLGSRSTDSLSQLGPDPILDGETLAVGHDQAAFRLSTTFRHESPRQLLPPSGSTSFRDPETVGSLRRLRRSSTRQPGP